MITDVINQTVVEKVILAEWEFSTIGNCLKGNRDALERVINYSGHKLKD